MHSVRYSTIRLILLLAVLVVSIFSPLLLSAERCGKSIQPWFVDVGDPHIDTILPFPEDTQFDRYFLFRHEELLEGTWFHVDCGPNLLIGRGDIRGGRLEPGEPNVLNIWQKTDGKGNKARIINKWRIQDFRLTYPNRTDPKCSDESLARLFDNPLCPPPFIPPPRYIPRYPRIK